jgi:phosphate transport system substrate-binding protein
MSKDNTDVRRRASRRSSRKATFVNVRALRLAALPIVGLTLTLSACGGQTQASGSSGGNGSGGVSGEVVVDGSSTVQPLTSAAGELFAEQEPGVNVSVATSGTGGGFEKFCQGQTDISDASRPIKDEEKAICEKNGITYSELHVATDALTVVVSKDNDFVDCLTTDELKTMWGPQAEDKVTTWKQVNAEFPDEPLELYGPGTDSGTFDYFTDEINGEEGASRSDYNASEDDNTLVQGVAGSPNALGYFGYSYYEENQDKLKAVEIDSGDGCVAPSVETAQDGSYTPLARPLFIYPSTTSMTSKKQVKEFITYYADNDEQITEAAKFIPLNDEQRRKLKDDAAKITG